VIDVPQAVTVDERFQPAAGDVLRRWLPGDVAAELKRIAGQG
jgi:hypothetical protein